MSSLTFKVGDDNWKKIRKLATIPIPGRHSALYYLNEKILGHGDLVPMTYRAHWAMCLFAEGATGIPEIDEARVKMILVPRGLGKSTLVTKGRTIQNLLRFDDWSVGIANEIKDNAEAFLASIKMEFETNDLLRALWPERVPSDFRHTTWKSDEIVINRKKPNPVSPSVLATGVGGTVVGKHMGEWICDDLLSKNAAEAAYRGNFGEIDSTNRWLVQLQPLLKSPKRDPISIVATRWWAGDTYEFAEKHWGHINHDDDLAEIPPDFECIWTLRLPDGQTQHIRLYRRGEIAIFRRPAIDESGASIFPERYTLEELEEMQREDPVFFAGQYLLEPTAGGASTFDPEWLRYYDWDGKQIYYRDSLGEIRYTDLSELAIFISVDPAFSDKHSAARSAIPVIATDGTRQFLLEDFAERYGVDDIAHQVVDFCLRYPGVRKIFVETIVAQVAVADAIRRIAEERGIILPQIEEIRSHGQQKKEWRIYGLEPYFRRGQFYIHKSHARFLHEYASFPLGALRDLLDAISFQRNEWERASRMGRTGQVLNTADRIAAEHSAMERVKAAFNRRRRRR